MISSKQRAKLKSLVSTEKSVYQVGKEGLSQNCKEGILQALEAREVIKVNILQSCELSPREVAENLAKQFDCEVVDVIGKKIILYKFNKDNKKHCL